MGVDMWIKFFCLFSCVVDNFALDYELIKYERKIKKPLITARERDGNPKPR